MNEAFDRELREHRKEIYLFLRALIDLGRPLLLRSDVKECLDQFLSEHEGTSLSDSNFVRALGTAQEEVVIGPTVFFALRPRIAQWEFLQLPAAAVV